MSEQADVAAELDAAIANRASEFCGPAAVAVASATVIAVQYVDEFGGLCTEYVEHYPPGQPLHVSVGLVQIHAQHLKKAQ